MQLLLSPLHLRASSPTARLRFHFLFLPILISEFHMKSIISGWSASTFAMCFWKQYDSLVFNFKTKTPSLGRTATPAYIRTGLSRESESSIKSIKSWRSGLAVIMILLPYSQITWIPKHQVLTRSPYRRFVSIPCQRVQHRRCISVPDGFETRWDIQPENFAGTYYSAFYIPAIGLNI